MLSFVDYLNEALEFAKAHDIDYLMNRSIITFAKGDKQKYKVFGKTAGRDTHAYKHLSKIDKTFIEQIVSQVRQKMLKYVSDMAETKPEDVPDYYQVNLYKHDGTPMKGDPISLVNKVQFSAIINYLDFINDKVILDEELTPFEQSLVSFIEQLGEHYEKLVQQVIDKCVSIDGMKTVDDRIKALLNEEAFSFHYRSTGGKNNRTTNQICKACIDTDSLIVVIIADDKVSTCYKLEKAGETRHSLLARIVDHVVKDRNFILPETEQAFKQALKQKAN